MSGRRVFCAKRVSFNAAYNNERMGAIVFLPRNAKPPYQTTVLFPGRSAGIRTSETLIEMPWIAPFIESGRALILPILKGTYERSFSGPLPLEQPIAWRDWYVQLHKDIGRTIDYLETRSDFDTDNLAYWGWSWGAWLGPIVSAMEPRLKVNVLVAGGLPGWRQVPEVDPLNFAPRVTVPTLIVNGRYDFPFPVESSQVPLFNAIGTNVRHKRHVVLESGHMVPVNQAYAEIFAWLDRYFGPVK